MTKKRAILGITDRDSSSRQVAIHNTAGDCMNYFLPVIHFSPQSDSPRNCSPVAFTLALTAGFLADLCGCNYLWTLRRGASVNIARGTPPPNRRKAVTVPLNQAVITFFPWRRPNLRKCSAVRRAVEHSRDYSLCKISHNPHMLLPPDKTVRQLGLLVIPEAQKHISVFSYCVLQRRTLVFCTYSYSITCRWKPAGPPFAFWRLISKRKHFHTKQLQAKEQRGVIWHRGKFGWKRVSMETNMFAGKRDFCCERERERGERWGRKITRSHKESRCQHGAQPAISVRVWARRGATWQKRGALWSTTMSTRLQCASLKGGSRELQTPHERTQFTSSKLVTNKRKQV